MELEARSLPTDASKPLLVKVKEYKADLNALKEKLRTAAASAPMGDAARAELVSAHLSSCKASST